MSDRTANLLGALALGVTDVIERAVRGDVGLRAAAALVHLDRTPGCTQQQLRAALALSQPATSHLVDRLVQEGFATRGAGVNGRSQALGLTSKGARSAAEILRARADALEALLATLEPPERRILRELLPALLAAMTPEAGDVTRICRLCDLPGCEAAGPCPVATAASTPPARDLT